MNCTAVLLWTSPIWDKINRAIGEGPFPLIGYLIGVLSGLSLLYALYKAVDWLWFHLIRWLTPWKSKHRVEKYITKDGIGSLTCYYLPNQLTWDHPSLRPQKQEGTLSRLLDYVVKGMMKDKWGRECKLYLVMAPTGVGKTAFLANFYEQYKAWGKHPRAVLLTTVANFMAAENLPAIFKCPAFKKRNTILLLDALDEIQLSTGNDNPTVADFEADLLKTWNEIRRLAPGYAAVMVTMREQSQQGERKLVVEYPLDGDNIIGCRIHLQPFKKDAGIMYLKSRVTDSEKLSAISALFGELYDEGMEFLAIPLVLEQLILHFAELRAQFVVKQQVAKSSSPFSIEHKVPTQAAKPTAGKNMYSRYQVVDTIIQAWFRREEQKTSSHSDVLPKLKQFCRELAYALHQLGVTQLPAEALTSFENDQKTLRALYNLENRALLSMHSEPDKSAKRKRKEPVSYFKFIHDIFQDYFLVKSLVESEWTDVAQAVRPSYGPYADRQRQQQLEEQKCEDVDERQEMERKVNFEGKLDALTFLLRYRWSTIEPPAAIPNTLDEMHTWAAFFNEFTCNEPAREMYAEPWGIPAWQDAAGNWKPAYRELGPRYQLPWEAILDAEVVGWRETGAFKRMTEDGLVITKANFWNNVSGKPDPMAVKVIRYLRNFVTEVDLQGLPLEGGMLDCFAGAEHIGALNLNETGAKLNGNSLAVFAASAKKIRKLNFREVNLSGGVAWFSATENVRTLDLNDTKMPGSEVVRCFANSAPTLRKLGLRGISMKGQNVSWFAQTKDLETLILSSTDLSAAQVDVFKNSASTLRGIGLAGIEIGQKELLWLATLKDLTYLGLAKTRLSAERVELFEESAYTLVTLDLKNLDLSKGINWFKDTKQLRDLILYNTNLPAHWVDSFKKSASTLRRLDLGGINLSEHQVEWLKYTNNLEWLSLNGTRLPASMLNSFANSAASLRILMLNGIDLSGTTVNWFNQAKSLNKLELDSTNISSQGFEQFASKKYDPTSLSLAIAGNPQINDESIARFWELCAELRKPAMADNLPLSASFDPSQNVFLNGQWSKEWGQA